MPLRDQLLKLLPKKSPNDLLIDGALSGIEALGIPTEYALGLLSGRPGERLTGEQALQQWGVTPEEHPPVTGQGFEAIGSTAKPYVAGLMGLGVETAADPLNLLGVGPAVKTAKEASRVKALNALSQKMRTAGAMPEEILEKLHPSMRGPEGKPRRMYHGTDRTGLEAQDLDPSQSGARTDTGFLGQGTYFSPEPEVANDYARNRRTGEPAGAVVSAYLDIRNPHRHDYTQYDDLSWTMPELRHMGGSVAPRTPSVDELLENSQFVNFGLKRRGQDAVVAFGNEPHHFETMVPDKSQIYSPYIAPALQPVPGVDPATVQRLAAYHAAKQGGR